MAGRIKTEFIENFLVVWDPKDGSKLYQNGYYGKPVGIPKPKVTEFNVPIILDLMEGLYLLKRKLLRFLRDKRPQKLNSMNLRQERESFTKTSTSGTQCTRICATTVL